MKLILTLLATTLFSGALFAQESPTTTPGTGGGQASTEKVVSPDFHPDGRVTFRLFAPDVTAVLVQGNWEGGRGLAMSKNDSGLWSVTTSAPLNPELWAYTFSVDGVRTLDPSNYNVARDGVGFMNTLLVLGDRSEVLQPQQVPHGTVRAMWVPSTLRNTPRRMFVYTPPGYESSTERYPVLYLLHGSGGDEDAWPTMGIANVIMDNVIAQGAARPMIVVMPNAYWNELASLDLAGPRTLAPPGVGSSGPPRPPMPDKANETDIVGDLIPFVDKHFRTMANRENRALAGLSMGSGITMRVAIPRFDVFASIGLLSSGGLRDPDAALANFAELNPEFLADPAATANKLRLMFFSCGTEDNRIDGMAKVAEELNSRGIPVTMKRYPGEHEWRVWRHSLADLAPLLFR